MVSKRHLLTALLFLVVSALTVQAQAMRPDDYIESIQEKYLNPVGLDFEQLDQMTQARIIGFSFGMELLAARTDFERIDWVQRFLYRFVNEFGGKKSETGKEVYAAYIGRYDLEMRKMLNLAPGAVSGKEQDSGGGIISLIRKAK